MCTISLVEISIEDSPPCPHSIAGSPSGNLAILRSRWHRYFSCSAGTESVPGRRQFALGGMAAKCVSCRNSIEVLTLLKNLFPAGARFGVIEITTKSIPRQGRTRGNRASLATCSRMETNVYCCALLPNWFLASQRFGVKEIITQWVSGWRPICGERDYHEICSLQQTGLVQWEI